MTFARDLRQLRNESGKPSYRVLSHRTNYSASALSQAANGRSLPTLAVTVAFVTACGGDAAEWEQRWQQVAASLRTADVPGQTDPTGEDQAPAAPASSATVETLASRADPDREAAGARWSRWVRRHRVASLAIAAACVVGIAAGTIVLGRPGPTAAASGPGSEAITGTPSRGPAPGAAEPVGDGSDPNRAGCGPGAVTVARTIVHFPVDQQSGELELRYSARCGTAWSRFVPYPTWRSIRGVVVTVWTVRPADQATLDYTVPFGGESIIGDMLRTSVGCVLAEVSMAQGSAQMPLATTACWDIRNSAPPPGQA